MSLCKKMKEKNLDNIIFSNVDVAKLDKEHVYVFRVAQEYINEAPKEIIEEMYEALKKSLDSLEIKYVILAGNVFEITELVKTELVK